MEYFEEKCNNYGFMPVDIPDQYENVFSRHESIRRLFEYFVVKKFKKFYSLNDWLKFAQDSSLSFGSRFHGNMAALNAGVPAVWFNHDMRTHELCEYHGLPNIKTDSKILDVTIKQIIDSVDYTGFIKKYSLNRERLRIYLNLSGVDNVL